MIQLMDFLGQIAHEEGDTFAVLCFALHRVVSVVSGHCPIPASLLAFPSQHGRRLRLPRESRMTPSMTARAHHAPEYPNDNGQRELCSA
jgi:hypothetical protein